VLRSGATCDKFFFIDTRRKDELMDIITYLPETVTTWAHAHPTTFVTGWLICAFFGVAVGIITRKNDEKAS
jgi:hypothetical protein